MPRGGLKGILYPTLLWLPATFGIWYFCGPLLAIIVASVLDLCLPLLTDGRITAVESSGELIQAVVSLGQGSYKGLEVPAGQTAELLIQARPMIFTYGMPVFLAFAFAADTRSGISRNLLGLCIVILVAVAAFGAAMELLKTVFLSMPLEMSKTSGVSTVEATTIAIGYQLSVLMLPLVVPVLLGCWLCAPWFRSALLEEVPTSEA